MAQPRRAPYAEFKVYMWQAANDVTGTSLEEALNGASREGWTIAECERVGPTQTVEGDRIVFVLEREAEGLPHRGWKR